MLDHVWLGVVEEDLQVTLLAFGEGLFWGLSISYTLAAPRPPLLAS